MAEVIKWGLAGLFTLLIVLGLVDAMTGEDRPEKYRPDKTILRKADEVDERIRANPDAIPHFIEKLAGTRPEHYKHAPSEKQEDRSRK